MFSIEVFDSFHGFIGDFFPSGKRHVSLVRFDFFDFPRRDINGARDNGFRALADGGFGRTHEYWTPTF